MRKCSPANLETALSGVAHSLVDVSQRQVAVQMIGPDARATSQQRLPTRPRSRGVSRGHVHAHDCSPRRRSFCGGVASRSTIWKWGVPSRTMSWDGCARRNKRNNHATASIGRCAGAFGECPGCRAPVRRRISRRSRTRRKRTPIGEVVVTAQRREQNIQDVGIAVTPLSDEALKDLNITTATDIVQRRAGPQDECLLDRRRSSSTSAALRRTTTATSRNRRSRFTRTTATRARSTSRAFPCSISRASRRCAGRRERCSAATRPAAQSSSSRASRRRNSRDTPT